MKVSRREFNKTLVSSALGVTAFLNVPELLTAARARSTVVIARSTKLKRIDNDVRKVAAVEHLNAAISKLTGRSNLSAAWRSLFSPNERIGIKLSCLPGKPLSSSRGLVMAIMEGLISAGVKSENIIVWERTSRELKKAGFKISDMGFKTFGTDFLYGGGYSNDIEFSGSVGTCFSRMVERVDAHINVPVLKDHDISGVSVSMKNFYGAIYNPNKFHGNNCDPYIADLNAHPFIKKKLRLIICDATRVQVHNGPAFFPRYAWEYGGLLVSQDPVALDYIGWQIIEKRRKELKLKTLKDENREPKYIYSAARLKLGNAGEKLIKTLYL
jgi:uncharacterized protein (DUF362 family)